MRTGFGALTLAWCVLAGAALAQDSSHHIGQRTVGSVHPFSLIARNDNCIQPLDFRFEFASSPWLRPQGDSVVRGVPRGESRSLPVAVDLTQMPPGRHVAEVDVTCENCRGFIFLNCRFDRQHLVLSVEAVAPAPTATAPARPSASPVRQAPRPRPEPAPQSTLAAPEPSSPAPDQTATAPMTAPSVSTQDQPACACDSDLAAWRWAAALAGIAAMAAGLAFASALAQARAAAGAAKALLEQSAQTRAKVAAKAREYLRLGQEPSTARYGSPAQGVFDGAADQARELGKKYLEQQVDELEERGERCRDELAALMTAQLQAMRSFSALGLAEYRQPGVAAQAASWEKMAVVAKRLLGEVAKAPDVRAATLIQVMESAWGGLKDRQTLFSSFSDGAKEHGNRIRWLREEGFAPSDFEAEAVIREMSGYAAHGYNMSDMNIRLQQKIEECRRCDAEQAILALLAETQ